MTTERCKRCHQFMPRYGQHRCPCDAWQHRRDRSALHRYAIVLVLALFVGGFGLLYVGTLPDAGLGSPATSEAFATPVYPGGGPVAAASLVPEGPSSQPAASPMTEPSADGYGSGTPVESMPAPDTATAQKYTGRASWFAARGDQGAVPWWRYGMEPVWATVTRFADGRTRSVPVLITGFCQCLVGTASERVIDLSDGAFVQLAPLSVGLIRVTVEIADQGPRVTPPATESEGMP